MIPGLLFGALAFLALLGWGVTLALIVRSLGEHDFRNAQALELEERVSNRIDERIGAVANRLRALQKKPDGKTEEVPVRPTTEETAMEAERRRQRILGQDPGDGEAFGEEFAFNATLGEQPVNVE